jgi:hypothetical protein
LLDLREGALSPRGLDPQSLLAAYMLQIQSLIAAVDQAGPQSER